MDLAQALQIVTPDMAPVVATVVVVEPLPEGEADAPGGTQQLVPAVDDADNAPTAEHTPEPQVAPPAAGASLLLPSSAEVQHQALRLTCPVCGKEFGAKSTPGARSNLLRHMRTHTGQRPHACTLCSATFTTLQNLRRHMAAKHPGSPLPPSRAMSASRQATPASPLPPPVSGFPSFPSHHHGGASSSTGQTARSPSPAVPLDDSRDDQGTSHRSAESPMLSSPVPPDPTNRVLPHRFQCHICGKGYAYKGSLQYHVRQVHPDTLISSAAAGGGGGGGGFADSTTASTSGGNPGQGPGGLEVECPDCFALLSSRSKLRRHLQKHCPFRREVDLRRRNREDGDHFNGDGSPADAALPTIEPPRRQPPRREYGDGVAAAAAAHSTTTTAKLATGRYRCTADGCFAVFWTQRALATHRAKAHPDDRPLEEEKEEQEGQQTPSSVTRPNSAALAAAAGLRAAIRSQEDARIEEGASRATK